MLQTITNINALKNPPKALLLLGLPLVLAIFIVGSQPCTAQPNPYPDRIITLPGDTVACIIPGNPRKETALPRRSLGLTHDYGFARIVAIFPNDSLRILEPPQINGFYRAKVGKIVGSGWYESRTIMPRWIEKTRRPQEGQTVFLQRITAATEVVFYCYQRGWGGETPNRYYFLWQVQKREPVVFHRYNQWLAWAKQNPPFDAIAASLPKPRGRKLTFFDYWKEVAKALQQQQVGL